MNVDRLREIANAIERDPESYRQSEWGSCLRIKCGHVCGTAGCVAGWAVVMFGGGAHGCFWNIPRRARELLGLTLREANALFNTSWPVTWRGARSWQRGSFDPSPTMATRVLRAIADGEIKL